MGSPALLQRVALCCAIITLVGCQTMFSTENWSAAFSEDPEQPRAPWMPSLWSPSTWNPFARPHLDTDQESMRKSALHGPALRHFLTESAWEFDPLVFAARPKNPNALQNPFVGRLSGFDADTPIRQSALYENLTDEDLVVSTGSAILLAQRGNPVGRGQLKDALDNPEFTWGLRCAAAESLGALGLDQELLKSRLIAARQAAQQPEEKYNPAWHTALVLATSASVHPSMDPELQAMFYQPKAAAEPDEKVKSLPAECQSPQPEVRAASLLAWRGSTAPFPEVAQQIKQDKNAKLRALYCRVSAVCGAAAEFEHAVDSLQDADLSVKYAAIELLGSMPHGTVEAEVAVEHLSKLLNERGGLLQTAAVESLGALSAWSAIREAAEHKSWRIRESAARQFQRDEAPIDPLLLEQLLADPNTRVQEAAVNALRTKPLHESGPLLLYAMEHSTRVARTNAETILALKWAPARILRQAGAKADSRLRMIEQLSQQLADETAQQVQAAGTTVAQANELIDAAEAGAAQIADSDLAEAVAVLLSPETPAIARDAAFVLIEQQGEEFAEHLDVILKTAEQNLAARSVALRSRLLPERIYTEVLPAHQPAFAALHKLATAQEPQSKQLAISELIQLAEKRPLDKAVIDRFASLMRKEQEAPLWRSALLAIGDSNSDAARHMARLAMAHSDAEVARLACEYFSTLGDTEAARLLSDSLDHPNSAVAIAAAAGLGNCQELPEVSQLEQLLVSPDRRIRIAAASSLSRHGIQTGSDALQRLVRDPDPQIRRESAAVMGTLKRIEYVPVLIELLDDSLGLRRAALQSLEEITLAYKIGPEADSVDPVDPATAWRAWYSANAAELSLLPPVAKEWSAVGVPSQPRAASSPEFAKPGNGDALFDSAPSPGIDASSSAQLKVIGGS